MRIVFTFECNKEGFSVQHRSMLSPPPFTTIRELSASLAKNRKHSIVH